MSDTNTNSLSWATLENKQRNCAVPEGNFAVKTLLFRGVGVRLDHTQLGETKVALKVTNPEDLISVLTEDDLLNETIATEGVEQRLWNAPFWGRNRPQLWNGVFRVTPEKKGEKSLWLGEGWINLGVTYKFRVYQDSLTMVFTPEKEAFQYGMGCLKTWDASPASLDWIASTFECDVSHLKTVKEVAS